MSEEEALAVIHDALKVGMKHCMGGVKGKGLQEL